MAVQRANRPFLKIVCVLALFIGPITLSVAANGVENQSGWTAFNIPSQSLGPALNAYSALTRTGLFYDGALAPGRRSTAVEGLFTPREALSKLLKDTELIAEWTDVGIVTISKAPAFSAADVAALKSRNASFASYLAVVQSSIGSALCRNSLTRTETTDVLVRFRISPSGLADQIEVLTSTGSPARDVAYSVALRSLDFGKPPPAAMPQPVTMLILQRNSEVAARCDPASPRLAGH